MFTVDLSSAKNFDDVITSFNVGLIGPSGGEWNGNWDAFHDYLSWPEADTYKLEVLGWLSCTALSTEQREMMQTIFSENSHVEVSLA